MKKASNKPSEITSSRSSWIIGDGEMAQRIREFDWTTTGLPAIEDWSNTLLTSVNMALQSPVPIVMLWEDDGIMIYNDAYSVFAGQRHPQLLGCKVLEGWPEVADFNANVMNVVYKQGKTLSYKDQELILYRNNRREQLWTDLNYSAIIRSDGTVGGVFAIVTETTDSVLAQQGQLQAEQELRDERERLKSLFEQAPALIAILRGPDHIFEMANPRYISTVAMNRSDIIGKPLVEALPELKGQKVLEVLDTVLRTNTAYVGEMDIALDRYNSGTLEDAYFNLVYQPVSSQADGTPDGIFVHGVEITDQVRSRQEAEQLSAELAAIFDSLPDGIFTTNLTHITHVNDKGAQLLGYNSASDVPTDLHEFYARLQIIYGQGTQMAPIAFENTSIGRALKGETVNNANIRVQNTEAGMKRVLRSAAAPIRDQNGAIIGAVATTSDMTEQSELQDQIQQDAIDRRVLSQKAKLLKSQNDQLTKLNETKDEFIALTSHQLRTPATGVKQYVGMIIQGFAGDITPQQRDFLERAYESNDRQLHIIDDILRVARIDLDQIKLSKTKRDAREFISDLISEQTDTFSARSQSVVINAPDEPVMMHIDGRNLGMALGNIIDNASKYTADSKTISVSLRRDEAHAIIDITDEGVGINEQDIDRLFQKFSRIPNERSIQVGGTGLGLYLSQRLIEKHGGSISVSSVEGVGTTFTVKLPIT